MLKICRVCAVEKPVEEFRNNKSGSGRRTSCRECDRALNKQWRQKRVAVFCKDDINLDQMKICTRCGLEKTKREFSFRKESKDGLSASCSVCSKNYLAKWNKTKKYNLEDGDYATMVLNQNGGCGICGATQPSEGLKKGLEIDHCHTTGKVRGLLCPPCNRAIGLLKDNPVLLEKAAEWIRNH